MGFFKTVGNIFKDFIAPAALSFIPGTIPGLGLALGPVLAATYSGIKTGVETGSPLAGLGSAGLSFGLSEIGRGIRGVDTVAKTGSGAVGTSVIEPSSSYITEGGRLLSRPASSAATKAATSTVPSFMQGTGGIQGPTTLGGLTVDQTAARTLQGAPGFTSITPTPVPDVVPSGFARKGLLERGVDAAFTPKKMFGNLTDYEMRPATLAGLGFVAKQAGTPPPEPAPFVPMQPQRRSIDMSKYGYKGPLQRGEYQYADPESLYDKRGASTYGYVGAKEGGVMKFQLGGAPVLGGFSPIDPNMTSVPSLPRTGGELPINIMSPPGGQAEPIETANFIGPAPINQPPMSGISQTLQKAGQQSGMPTPSPTQTMQGMTQTLSKDVQPFPPGGSYSGQQIFTPKFLDNFKPMDTDQPRVDNFVNTMKAREIGNVIRNLPRKPIDVTFSGLGSLGLATGGEVPGMSEQAPDKQGAFNMAQGGEVQSNETLQENAFVIPADVVGHIGDGSSDAGAQRLQQFLGMNPQQYQAGGIMAGELQGPGGGMDDLIQTSIEGKQAAAVSPQEFVVPRDIVAELGKGSYDQGSKKLYALMRNVRKFKTGKTEQPAELNRGLNTLMRSAVA